MKMRKKQMRTDFRRKNIVNKLMTPRLPRTDDALRLIHIQIQMACFWKRNSVHCNVIAFRISIDGAQKNTKAVYADIIVFQECLRAPQGTTAAANQNMVNRFRKYVHLEKTPPLVTKQMLLYVLNQLIFKGIAKRKPGRFHNIA